MGKKKNEGLEVELETPEEVVDSGVKDELVIPETPVKTDTEPKFTKEQILSSHWYSHRRDLLSTLLSDGELYSHSEVNNKIKEFEEKKVV